MPLNIRLTVAGARLLSDTARHVGRSESELVRATVNGIRRKRHVIQIELDETYYRKPTVIKNFRGTGLPDETAPEEFRRILALRCLEELAKPQRRKAQEFREIEGRDYIVEKEDND